MVKDAAAPLKAAQRDAHVAKYAGLWPDRLVGLRSLPSQLRARRKVKTPAAKFSKVLMRPRALCPSIVAFSILREDLSASLCG